ncbi:MAG: hypothetical protein V2A71_08235, partial [Candidatus Eisenbacteria bacterium]
RWSPSGEYIAYVSDEGGVPDLYVMNVQAATAARLTNSTAGVLTPSWGRDDSTLYFTALANLRYSMFGMTVDFDSLSWQPIGTPTTPGRDPWIPPEEPLVSTPYTRTLGLDWARSAIAYDPEFATLGLGQLALSDVLGNEHFLFYLGSHSETGGSFLGTLSAGGTYLNLSRRLHYGVGLFSVGIVYDEELEILREERRSGCTLTASYPISTFARLDASLVTRLAKDHAYRSGKTADALLLSNYLSYVWDNGVFRSTGDVIGTRANLTVGFTRDVTRGTADYAVGLLDLRESGELAGGLVYAGRFVFQSSFGEEGTRFRAGGPWSFRGYTRRALSGRTLLVFNNEVRLPVLGRLALGRPGHSLPLPSVRGALLFDAGTAGDGALEPWKGSLGFGLYVGGGYFPVVRFNVVWRTDFETTDERPIREFFLGWNY